jgi:glutathione S-transferase
MLTLFTSKTTPFGRKVWMVAIESGLQDKLTITHTDPFDPEYRAINPLGKIPALQVREGMVLFDSPVIAEYLIGMGGGGLLPTVAERRFVALRQQAVADGMIDACVLRLLESRRPVERQHAPWVERQWQAVSAGLDFLEKDVASGRLDPQLLTIGSIATAAALGYLDFRFASDAWRPAHPELAAWHSDFAARNSYVVTAPSP